MRFPQEAYEHESTKDVFDELLLTTSDEGWEKWAARYDAAAKAEADMRRYNKEYDDSLLHVARGGQ